MTSRFDSKTCLNWLARLKHVVQREMRIAFPLLALGAAGCGIHDVLASCGIAIGSLSEKTFSLSQPNVFETLRGVIDPPADRLDQTSASHGPISYIAMQILTIDAHGGSCCN